MKCHASQHIRDVHSFATGRCPGPPILARRTMYRDTNRLLDKCAHNSRSNLWVIDWFTVRLRGNDINHGIRELVLDRVELEHSVRPTPSQHPLLFHEFHTTRAAKHCGSVLRNRHVFGEDEHPKHPQHFHINALRDNSRDPAC